MPHGMSFFMVSLAKKRIEEVFIDTLQKVRNGTQPNIERSMIKQGYSASSARANKVVKTKTWEALKKKYIKDDLAAQTFHDLAQPTNEDKDNRLKASIEILKLNDRYPAQKSKILGLFGSLEELE